MKPTGTIQLSELKLNPSNPRFIKDDKFASLCKSLKDFPGMMELRPIITDKHNVILGGNMRYRALMELQYKEIPRSWVKQVGDLSKQQVREFIIKDNLAFGEWDFDLLANNYTITELIDMGMDESLLDVNLWNPEITDEELDAVPEPQKDPISKLGDIFLIDGKHRVMCGDSTIKADVEALMAGKRADMVFTDPPYGMNLEVDQWNKDSKNGKYFGHNKNYKKVIGDSDSDFNPKFITNIFDFFGYCKEIFLWGADYYSEFLIEKNKGCWMVWDKRDKLENVEWKTSEFELCWSKKKHQRKIARIRWLGLHGIESEDTKRRIHPTQKPTKLIIWFFEKFSFQQGETIIDLFLGSGSTLIASQQTNRICYGMELDPIYIDVILRRYKNLYPEAKFECLNRKFNFNKLFEKI